MVYKLYIIKAGFFLKAGEHLPSLAYRGIVGIKQNGPVKHFKGMLVVFVNVLSLCGLHLNSIVIC